MDAKLIEGHTRSCIMPASISVSSSPFIDLPSKTGRTVELDDTSSGFASSFCLVIFLSALISTLSNSGLAVVAYLSNDIVPGRGDVEMMARGLLLPIERVVIVVLIEEATL